MEKYFKVKQENVYSGLNEIKVEVPQGSVLGPILYLLYPIDLPGLENNTETIFSDDTAILAAGSSNDKGTEKIQTPINQIQN